MSRTYLQRQQVTVDYLYPPVVPFTSEIREPAAEYGDGPGALPGPGEPIELIVVSRRRGRRLRCRQVATGLRLTLELHDAPEHLVEGEHLAARVEGVEETSREILVTASFVERAIAFERLGVEPLALTRRGFAKPSLEEEPERRAGLQVEYELERVPPGARDVCHRAFDLWTASAAHEARALLGELLAQDVRCLDAHSHLGYFAFNGPPEEGGAARALRHFRVGIAIAEAALGPRFDGLLPWSRRGNRPFLRCLYGHALCLWRLGDLDDAERLFLRLCDLSPDYQLAARLALARLREREPPE